MSIWGNPVMMGGSGGGGGTPAVYSGTETPAAGLGWDGDVYIRYTVQGNSGMVDSQLGWACPPLYYAAKANTEYGSISGRWYKKSYNAPGIVCYALHNTGSIPGAASPYTFPMTISTTKNGASKIDGYTQQPTADGEWRSCTYGGLTWWFDIGYGMGSTFTASGGQLSLQPRINLPSTVTSWEAACQYILQTIGVQTGIATPGNAYVKVNGVWTQPDYPVISSYLPNSNGADITCFARYENFDSSELSWGEGVSPVTLSAAVTQYQSENAVYLDSKTGSKKFSISLPTTTSDFTLYCVAKGLDYVSGDVIIMGSVYSWNLEQLIMLYHRSGDVWRTSVYGNDSDLVDTNGGYVAVAIRSDGMKASWFASGGTSVEDVSYTAHGTEFTFGSYGSGNYSTDLAVKFIGMSMTAESDSDIAANLSNLASIYGLA